MELPNKLISSEVSDNINSAISNLGSNYNPALVSLLLSGKVKGLKLTSSNRELLTGLGEFHDTLFQNMILPKLKNVLSILTNKKVDFVPSLIKVRPKHSLKEQLTKSYQDGRINKDFKLARPEEADTEDSLLSNKKFCEGEEILMGYTGASIYRTRTKLDTRKEKKIERRFSVFDLEHRVQFPKFLNEVCNDPYSFWDPTRHEHYVSNFYPEVTETLLGDTYGLKYIILDYNKAQEAMKCAFSKRELTDINGFFSLPERFDDHRERAINEKKPGGLHFTLVDKGSFFLVEVQIVSIRDEIYDNFGPRARKRFERN